LPPLGWFVGKKVQLIEATFERKHDVARATALRIRRQSADLDDLPMDGAMVELARDAAPRCHVEASMMDFTIAPWSTASCAASWRPAARRTGSAQGAHRGRGDIAACRRGRGRRRKRDLGVLPPDRFTYINPDLTQTLHRYPRDEWVCLDARTRVEPNGVGMAESRLFDRSGPIGRAVQCLILDERPRE
jgi:hypothetical protein